MIVEKKVPTREQLAEVMRRMKERPETAEERQARILKALIEDYHSVLPSQEGRRV